MGFNAAANAVYIGILLYLLMGFAIIFTVGNQFDAAVRAEFATLGISPATPYDSLYATSKELYLTSAKWLLWFLIGLTIMSSFVEQGDFRTYVFGSMAAIIASAVITLIGTMVWNGFISTSAQFLDFSDLQDGFMFIAENFVAIILINLVAGLASFIWKRKPDPLSVGYY